jgi:hypothetical protein
MIRSQWKAWLSGVIGFGIGVMMFHTSSVKAQVKLTTVTIERVPSLGLRGAVVPLSRPVVGFSCVPEDGQTACYVATAQ